MPCTDYQYITILKIVDCLLLVSEINFCIENQKQNTLKEFLDYLESYPKMIVFAIDEFQQIREYEGINMEARSPSMRVPPFAI